MLLRCVDFDISDILSNSKREELDNVTYTA